MKKRIIQILFISLGVLTFNLVGCQPSQKDKRSETVPAHPIEKGVSAPFAGFIGEDLLVGGGCNFPETPAAVGGKKVYYADIFSWDSTSDSALWKHHAELPYPIAYGATVEVAEGLICIGGMNATTSLKDVYRIGKDKESNRFTWKTLPSLPESIDNATATCIGRSLYVTGGNQGHGGNALYTLNLDQDTTWTKLADYPGAKRIQPVLLASDEELYLFGGFEVKTTNNKEVTDKEGVISSDFITYNVKENVWSRPQAIPTMNDGSTRALVGAAGTRVSNLFVIAGGVNYSIFKAAVEGKAPSDYMKRPANWYQFSKDVLVYNLQSKEWKVIADVDGFNKAGGSLLHHNGSIYMVCGEIKPGIRTNEIVTKDLKQLLQTTH